jgi:hypothetical protein
MGKFERYAKRKMSFKIDEVDMDIEFKVKDRIELATIHECKNQGQQYEKLIDFCTRLLVRSYPNEDEETLCNFLSTNLEKFIEEIMVGANLAKREQFAQRNADFRKKEEKKDDKGGVPADAPAKQE